MQYAQINESGEAIQVTTSGNVEWDKDHFCPASALTPDEAAMFSVVQLLETDQPTFDASTHMVVRDGCELVGGNWQYKWRIDALTPAQIEANRIASIPTSVTMRQACLALDNAGILDDVEALVATLPRPYQIEWQRASMVERTNQLVEVVRQQQGMTVQQIDDMFIQAATL